eukprot:m51a1_g10326 hypothetical protein (627) ;mRNA; r:76422-78372
MPASACSAALVLLALLACPALAWRSALTLSQAPHSLVAVAPELFCRLRGCALVPVGDFDRDGADDVAFVAAHSLAGDPSPLWLVTLVFGAASDPADVIATSPTTAPARRSLQLHYCSAAAAPAVAGVGDFDGDGVDDVAVACGAALWVYSGGGGGEAPRVVGGPVNPAVAVADVGVARAGDIDGDGLADVTEWHSVGNGFSVSQVLFGFARPSPSPSPSPSSSSSSSSTSTFSWATRRSQLLITVSRPASSVGSGAAGDIDGDRVADWLLSLGLIPTYHELLVGGRAGYLPALKLSLPAALLDVAGVGDVDGDACDDLALVLGDGGPVRLLFGANASELVRVRNVTGLPSSAATRVLAAGDVDGDGAVDVLVADASANASRVALLHGARGRRDYSAATDVTTIDDDDDGSGGQWTVGPGGDWDGDGVADVVVVPRPWGRAFAVGAKRVDGPATVVLRLEGSDSCGRNASAVFEQLRAGLRGPVGLVAAVEPLEGCVLLVVRVLQSQAANISAGLLASVGAVVVPESQPPRYCVVNETELPAPAERESDHRTAYIILGVCAGCAVLAAAVLVAVALVVACRRARTPRQQRSSAGASQHAAKTPKTVAEIPMKETGGMGFAYEPYNRT